MAGAAKEPITEYRGDFMASVNIEKLLQPISAEAPCGPDFEYEQPFTELVEMAKGTPERGVGTSIIPAVEPSWKDVKQRCVELLEQTKDLRVLVYLHMALVNLEGLCGLRDAMSLLRGMLEGHWGCLHPKLDPDDNNDPTERV